MQALLANHYICMLDLRICSFEASGCMWLKLGLTLFLHAGFKGNVNDFEVKRYIFGQRFFSLC